MNTDELRDLILTAEDQDFTPEQSPLVSAFLLDYALQNRNSSDPVDVSGVLSAIRTGASMLRPREAWRLMPLLDDYYPIDTRVVALKMLGRIFKAQPPDGPDQHKGIADVVRRIAEWELEDWSEDPSSRLRATIQLAVYAIVAMKGSQAAGLIKRIGDLCPEWFVQQLERELAGLNVK